MKLTFPILIGIALALQHTARAAETPSFDCAKSKSVIEKIICADPKLASADRKMAAAYRAALAGVSPEGQAALRSSQRQWLDFVDVACVPRAAQSASEATSCLEQEYNDRNTRLANAVHKSGGVTFRDVATYRLEKVTDPDDTGTGAHAGFLTIDLSYPVIDAPKTDAERGFNRYMQNQAQGVKGEDGSDLDLGFGELAATPRLISVELTSGYYAHGTPHGQYTSRAVHWLLPEGRLLNASDVFKPNTPWREILRTRCFAEVAQFGFIKSKEDLTGMVEDPQDWSFDAKGLWVNFNSYEVASYADGQPDVLIPWADLREYLVKGAPVP